MTTDISHLLDRYEPISLASMDATAGLQTRFDTKYILPWDIFNDWQQSLTETHRVLEIEDHRIFTYDTQYFDTPLLDLYRANMQGKRKRFKVRTRQYVETGFSFLEIKFKGGRGETIKKRIPHDPTRLNIIDGEANSFVQNCVETLYEQKFTAPLLPSIQTHYRRCTLVSRESSERITCDFDLDFQRSGASPAGLRENYVLIEIKTTRGRSSSDRALWRRGIRPMGGSKYCIGVSMMWKNMKNNAYRRQVRRFYH